MKTISIHREDRSFIKDVIPAFRLGKLAVHSNTNEDGKGWVITHIPTGWRCFPPIRTKRKAITMCKVLVGALDWNFRSPYSPKVRAQNSLMLDICRCFGYTYGKKEPQ